MKTNKDTWLNYVGELRVPKQKQGESEEDYKDRCKKTKVVCTAKEFAVTEGSIIRLQKYEEYLQGRLSSGTMDQDDFDRKLKRSSFVKYVLHIVPQNQEVDVAFNSEWLNDAFEIRRKDGGEFYIKVKKDFAVAKDTYLPLKKVTEKLKELKAKGFLDEKTYEERLNKLKIKDADGKLTNNMWLIYTATVPPCKD